MKDFKDKIPDNVNFIINMLQTCGYDTYLVGGSIRDLLLDRIPKDWDIATSATPSEVTNVFNNNIVIPTGEKYGTVTIILNDIGYEITTFRDDGEYVDGRRPKEVTFSKTIYEDLSRRDLTINAFAYNEDAGLIDYFNGIEDLNNKIIKCVGDPEKRFKEDAVRMIRAIRLSSQLNFKLSDNIFNAICKLNKNIVNVSNERIRDELCKILISSNPAQGMRYLVETGLCELILPELNRCVNFNQHNKHHDKDVFEHTMKVLETVPSKLELRLSALFHDIAKPLCFTIGEDSQGHFLEHHKIGSDLTREIMSRLKFDHHTTDIVCLFVYEHMINTTMGTAGLKRLIRRVGPENIYTLFSLAIGDRQGMSIDYSDITDLVSLKLSTVRILCDNEAISLKDLKINGKIIMNKFNIKPSPIIGNMLNECLEAVIEGKVVNDETKLLELVDSKFISLSIEKDQDQTNIECESQPILGCYGYNRNAMCHILARLFDGNTNLSGAPSENIKTDIKL